MSYLARGSVLTGIDGKANAFSPEALSSDAR